MTTWIIVEDEPDVYAMLLAMTQALGSEGIAFVNGEEAVAWIDDADQGLFLGELPELALLDVRLPNEISGSMVGARLRKSPRLGNIAVVLMTAYKLDAEQEKALIAEAGADLLIGKPLPDMGTLKQMLGAAIAARPKPAVAAAPAVSAPAPVAAAPAVPMPFQPKQPVITPPTPPLQPMRPALVPPAPAVVVPPPPVARPPASPSAPAVKTAPPAAPVVPPARAASPVITPPQPAAPSVVPPPVPKPADEPPKDATPPPTDPAKTP